MHIIDKEDPGGRTVADRQQNPADALEEAALGARSVERRGGGKTGAQLCELGQQPRGLGQQVGRDLRQTGGDAFPSEGGGEPLDEGAVGEIHLSRIATRRDGRRTPARRVSQELLGQPGLADAGLSLQNHDVNPAPGSVVGPEQGPPLFLPADQRFVVGNRMVFADGRILSLLGSRSQGSVLRESRRRWQVVLFDGLVDPGRLLQRGDAQLPLEDANALPVLAQGTSALASPRVDLH